MCYFGDSETPDLTIEQLNAHDICYEQGKKSEICECEFCSHSYVCSNSEWHTNNIDEDEEQ